MRKAFLIAVLTVKSIFIVVAVVALILAISVYGNDTTTAAMALLFIASVIISFICGLIESLIKDQLDRLKAREDRMFCNITPCRNGWRM